MDVDVEKMRSELEGIRYRAGRLLDTLPPKPEPAPEPWALERHRAWLVDEKAEAMKQAKYERAAALRDCLERIPEPPEPEEPYRVQPTPNGYWQVLDREDALIFQTRHEGLARSFAASSTFRFRLEAAEGLLQRIRTKWCRDSTEPVPQWIDQHFKDTRHFTDTGA